MVGTEQLEYYKNQFKESLTTNDKYKERVDKYLAVLIEDRHELKVENERKEEKIKDLQTAFVEIQVCCLDQRKLYLEVAAENEKLKENEKQLHENIRRLLSETKEKNLRDRIIYILNDPKVEIGYQHGNSNSQDNFASALKSKRKTDEFLKEQIHQLQAKLDEHSKISQNNADVIVQDCKITLEKAKEKLLQNEEQIGMLRKRLHDADELLKREDKFPTPYTSLERNEASKEDTTSDADIRNTSKSAYERISIPSLPDNKSSIAEDMHTSLLLLLKNIEQSVLLLKNIQSSQVFIQASKLPNPTGGSHKFVNETDITQLQNYVRQCTRLSSDVRISLKLLRKKISSEGSLSRQFNISSVLEKLEALFDELAVATADVDLVSIHLSRATFFEYLTAPKQSFTKFGVKEINNCSKYVDDVNKMVVDLKRASGYALKAVKCIEKIQEGLSKSGLEIHRRQEDSKTRRNVLLNERAVITENPNSEQDKPNNSQSVNFSIKFPIEKRVGRNSVEIEALVRRIDKTLSKIKQIESGEYIKDNEFCKYLGEQVHALTEKLKKLYNEFNVQDIQDQFSEYSSVTLSKLETLAKQSRDAVGSAEAQISAHKSHARNLLQKLKETEELLRVSIDECLTVKQQLQKEKFQRGAEAAQFRDELHEKLQNVADFDELETAVKEVMSSTHFSKDAQTSDAASISEGQQQPMHSTGFDDPETSVGSMKGEKISDGPFQCMYCKQASGHKLCDEKIRELRANNRKLATELKILQQEVKEEKKLSKMSQAEVARTTRESTNQSGNLRSKVESLESRNASLLEQLNLERNRLKKMEKFHRFEIAGSKTDINNLKVKIQDLEKQLMKAVLIFEHDKNDIELLKSVHTTAQNSKQTADAVRRLKRKVYEIETDLKHL